MQTLVSALEKAELLLGMEPARLHALAECASDEEYEADDHVSRWGEVADAFWLVREGRAALELDVPGRGQVTIALMQAGDIVGFSWLCPPHVMHFDVRAASRLSLTRFDAAAVRARCEKDTALGYDLALRFARLAADRVDALYLQLLDVYGEHPVES